MFYLLYPMKLQATLRAIESSIYANGCYHFWIASTILGSVTVKVFAQSLTKKVLSVWISKYMTSVKFFFYIFLQFEWNSLPI